MSGKEWLNKKSQSDRQIHTKIPHCAQCQEPEQNGVHQVVGCFWLQAECAPRHATHGPACGVTEENSTHARLRLDTRLYFSEGFLREDTKKCFRIFRNVLLP